MLKWISALLGTGLLLAGCGGDSEDPVEATISAESAPATLKATCPQVEAALPNDSYSRSAMFELADRLRDLRNVGDVETQNAIDILRRPTSEVANASGGLDLVEAHAAWLRALDNFALRCKARWLVGSPVDTN